MNLNLTSHIAVITGGASGIGLACARSLAAEGCHIALWDTSPDTPAQAAAISREFNFPTLGLIIDVCSFQAVQAATAQTESTLGPINHLVHAAAVGSGKFGFPFSNLTPADWTRVLDVSIMGMVHVAHAVTPSMIARRRGTLVFLGSVAGQIGSQTDPPYSAAKAAGINFAQCLAKDLAPHDIRVNTVNPGMVRTPLSERIFAAWNEKQPPSQQTTYEKWAGDKVRAVTPLGRFQDPSDIGDMVAFLSSDRARQVTGQTINVDGGWVMHW